MARAIHHCRHASPAKCRRNQNKTALGRPESSTTILSLASSSHHSNIIAAIREKLPEVILSEIRSRSIIDSSQSPGIRQAILTAIIDQQPYRLEDRRMVEAASQAIEPP